MMTLWMTGFWDTRKERINVASEKININLLNPDFCSSSSSKKSLKNQNLGSLHSCPAFLVKDYLQKMTQKHVF